MSSDPVQAIISLCEDVKRFAATRLPLPQVHCILSQYLSHLDKCTTPLLREFMEGKSHQEFLFLLLAGALDTMDTIQSKYERSLGDQGLSGLLDKLSDQINEIHTAAKRTYVF